MKLLRVDIEISVDMTYDIITYTLQWPRKVDHLDFFIPSG